MSMNGWEKNFFVSVCLQRKGEIFFSLFRGCARSLCVKLKNAWAGCPGGDDISPPFKQFYSFQFEFRINIVLVVSVQ